MKLLDPLEGLIATIRCIQFQIIFATSAIVVSIRRNGANDEGDIIS